SSGSWQKASSRNAPSRSRTCRRSKRASARPSKRSTMRGRRTRRKGRRWRRGPRHRASRFGVEMGSAVFINVEHPEGSYAARVLRGRAREFLERLGVREVCSRLVTTDTDTRRLKREFRGIARPTDVPSFPAGEPLPGEDPYLGDLAISLDTARRRAREHGRP